MFFFTQLAVLKLLNKTYTQPLLCAVAPFFLRSISFHSAGLSLLLVLCSILMTSPTFLVCRNATSHEQDDVMERVLTLSSGDLDVNLSTINYCIEFGQGTWLP